MAVAASLSCVMPQTYGTPQMGDFMDRLIEVRVDFDRFVHYPGDEVTGKVIILPKRQFACDTIEAVFSGNVRIFWTENKFEPNSHSAVKTYGQRWTLFEQTRDLWQVLGPLPKMRLSMEQIQRLASPHAIRSNALRTPSPNHVTAGLEADRHYTFPFAFKLPADSIPSSFQSAQCPGIVEYGILIRISAEGHIRLQRQHPFAVATRNSLTRNPPLAKPIEVQKVVLLKGREGSRVEAKLALAKRGFLPSDKIDINVRIQNGTTKSLKFVHVDLVQKTTAWAWEPTVGRRDDVRQLGGSVGLGDRGKVRAGETLADFRPVIYAPSVTPPIHIHNVLDVSYAVRLRVDFERRRKGAASNRESFLEIEIPFEILTDLDGGSDAEAGVIGNLTLPVPPAYPASSLASSTVTSASSSTADFWATTAAAGNMVETLLPPPPSYADSQKIASNNNDGRAPVDTLITLAE